MNKHEKRYKEWEKHRDEELGSSYFCKLICDDCGYKFCATIVQTLPPCPKCGGDVYEYDIISVSA